LPVRLPFHVDRRENAALFVSLLRLGVLGAVVGALAGALSAVFLLALDRVTAAREAHPWLLFLLPLAGYVVGFVYDRFGRSVAAGNNLLLERIHSPNAAAVPFRMAPLVLAGTVVTHLFGGSAGREGTAVQMGGTMAGLVGRVLRAGRRERRLLLMAGISGGFGSVFGTPLAGTVFGLEVLSVGRVGYAALVPCLAASVVGDAVCRALGVGHHAYAAVSGLVPPALTPAVWALVLLAGALFAGAAAAFTELTEAVSHVLRERIARPELRPVVGGLAVIALTYLVGSRDYPGLSLPLLERAFTPGSVPLFAFALKLVFTAVTVGSGFKGGEVTPLFVIGATLGAAFARLTGQPEPFFAALGFVAVFAGAANTPLACALMGVELFGARVGVPITAACVVSYVLSGHRGIYAAQFVGTPKAHGVAVARGTRLRDARAAGRRRLRALPFRRR
jgi:H+/Cl- antiporter ClcA